MKGERPRLRLVGANAACTICGKPVDAKYQPFCSKRCADIDLGRWLKEDYRVQTDEAPGERDTEER